MFKVLSAHLTSYLCRGRVFGRVAQTVTRSAGNGLPDDHSELEPPDPFSNSAVKRFSADGSVGFPHVRVGHRQASSLKPS